MYTQEGVIAQQTLMNHSLSSGWQFVSQSSCVPNGSNSPQEQQVVSEAAAITGHTFMPVAPDSMSSA